MLNKCSECDGNGYFLEDCPYCLGKGTLENGDDCDECSGEEKHVCEACDGTGEAEDEEDDE